LVANFVFSADEKTLLLFVQNIVLGPFYKTIQTG